MTKYIRYYEDDSAAVEWTNYVDLDVDVVAYTLERDLDIRMGDSGTNLYRDTIRYTQRWVIEGECDRRTQDTLRGWADNTFDSNTTLRVYDKYAANYYNDYTGVKIKSFSTRTLDGGGGTRYAYTLVVVK